MTRPNGSLLLVPNTLDLGSPGAPPIDEVLAAGVLQKAAGLVHWIAEDAKTTRIFLKRVGALVPLAAALQQIEIRELPRPAKGSAATGADSRAYDEMLAPALSGQDVGLISEAGLPAVADPAHW
jgi:16S rRNA (cytidine1402-2'-O)-methyltransferase